MRLTLLFLLFATGLFATEPWQSKLSDELLIELERGGTERILVRFSAQADLSAAASLTRKEDKAQYVYQRLSELATTSQKDVREYLKSRQVSFNSFVMVNALAIETADLELVRNMAERPEVARIMPNPWTRLEDMAEPLTPAVDLRGGPQEVEWNIAQINAPQVWDMGFRGAGVVVGNQDTGIDWDHVALIEQYRGSDENGSVDHNYNWFDAIDMASPLNNDDDPNDPEVNPCGFNSTEPCDDNGHGTYTVGISVGEEGGNQVGVAPEAEWIGCRNMDRGWGSPETYLECFEFFLAPTDVNGENPDPSRAPHVINNSWGCPEVEGCNEDNFALLETAVNNLKAAGVVVVVSAGNSGSDCSTISNPAAIYQNSFTVGATNQQDTIANFSSRGPVLVGTDLPYRKPDISAPGVNIRAPRRFDTYNSGSGTSAAGPHVAGLVALMINANPDLAGQVETIETIIEQTALGVESDQECGTFTGMGVPNITYGYGRIDALAAVNMALTMVDVREVPGLQGLRITPNPTNGPLVISADTELGTVELRVNDVHGKILRSETIVLNKGGVVSLDLNRELPGIYFVRIGNGKRFWMERVIRL